MLGDFMFADSLFGDWGFFVSIPWKDKEILGDLWQEQTKFIND